MGNSDKKICHGVCGSPNHWDKECPDWNVYLETRNRSAHFTVGQSDGDSELEERYCAAYTILLNNRIAEQILALQEPSPFTSDQDFDQAVVMSLIRQSNHNSHGHKSYTQRRALVEEALDEDDEFAKSKSKLTDITHILEHISDQTTLPVIPRKSSPRPSVVEVDDKEDVAARSKPKAVDPQWILEEIDESKGAEPPPIWNNVPQDSRSAYNAHRMKTKDQLEEDSPNPDRNFTLPFHDMPGPPAPLAQVRMPKARITKPGVSAVGVSVLSTRG